MDSDEDNVKEKRKHVVIKNSSDLQRMKLEKLMQNPEKPVIIPERPKPRGVPVVPDFVRNVMGSSAGAGSGEFHVYRHLRRKEYARQKYMQEKGERERLDEEYRKKLDQNKLEAEAKTAKKRAKRLKKKGKYKGKQKKPKLEEEISESDSESSSNEECQDNEVKIEEDSKPVDEHMQNAQLENENNDDKQVTTNEFGNPAIGSEPTVSEQVLEEKSDDRIELEQPGKTCDEDMTKTPVFSNEEH